VRGAEPDLPAPVRCTERVRSLEGAGGCRILPDQQLARVRNEGPIVFWRCRSERRAPEGAGAAWGDGGMGRTELTPPSGPRTRLDVGRKSCLVSVARIALLEWATGPRSSQIGRKAAGPTRSDPSAGPSRRIQRPDDLFLDSSGRSPSFSFSRIRFAKRQSRGTA